MRTVDGRKREGCKLFIRWLSQVVRLVVIQSLGS